MENAVRALVDNGVAPKRILVSRGAVVNGRFERAPERTDRVVTGLVIGAILGGTLALVWLLAIGLTAQVEIPAPWLALRVLGGAASGAVIGALLTIIIRAAVRGRRRIGAEAGDFVVTVRTPDEREAANVGDLLAHRGGELLPA